MIFWKKNFKISKFKILNNKKIDDIYPKKKNIFIDCHQAKISEKIFFPFSFPFNQPSAHTPLYIIIIFSFEQKKKKNSQIIIHHHFLRQKPNKNSDIILVRRGRLLAFSFFPTTTTTTTTTLTIRKIYLYQTNKQTEKL